MLDRGGIDLPDNIASISGLFQTIRNFAARATAQRASHSLYVAGAYRFIAGQQVLSGLEHLGYFRNRTRLLDKALPLQNNLTYVLGHADSARTTGSPCNASGPIAGLSAKLWSR